MRRFGVEEETKKNCWTESRGNRGRSFGFKKAVHM